MFETPNIDALDDDELNELDRTLTRLALITDAHMRARKLRKAGDIEAALSWARFANVKTATLPQWAKW